MTWKYFTIIIIIAAALSSSFAQFENMTQEEIRKKAEEMGYSIEDYLKIKQTQIPRRSSDVKRTADRQVKEEPGEPEIIPPVNKPLESYYVPAFKERELADSLPAFGYKIFASSPTAFESSLNVPVPASYIVGPGDELIITLWGETELELQLDVNKEGNIYIPDVGLINVNGLSLTALRNKLYNILSKTYSSLDASAEGGATTSLDVSTGSLRTVKIYVLGEVNKPGGYTLPSLSTSFTALYYSGGPSLDGSLRNIKILRNGETISVIDLYSYLARGDKAGDVMLDDGDIIFIPPVGERAAVAGSVFRPAVYELKENDKLKDIIAYSGGLSFNAFFERIHIERIIPFEQRSNYENNILDIDLNFSSVNELRNSNYDIENGDVVNIPGINNMFENRVEISGSVKQPGIYEISSREMTISDLINAADGLSQDAFKEKAVLIRTMPDEKKEVLNFNVGEALEGNPSDNLKLRNRDEIEIYSMEKFFPTRYVEIDGAIVHPGSYKRHRNMTLTDLIILSGGLTDSATTDDIEITRMDTLDPTIYAEKYLVSLSKDYWNSSNGNDFLLRDYDRVLVKRDPAKTFNRKVIVSGEVKFPGKYTQLSEDEKVYDFIKRAGGFKHTAYKEGMYVYRPNAIFSNTQNEIIPDTLRRTFKDIPIYDRNIFNREYSNRIPILWEDIMEDTSSVYNIPLEPGDSLVIPKNPNVIYVLGEVGIPSSVPYQEDAGLDYYVNQAGGYTESSGRGFEIVILPNGKKWNPSHWFFIPDPEILSGSTVIVPTLIESESQFWPVIRDVAAVVTSTAVLILTVNNLTK